MAYLPWMVEVMMMVVTVAVVVVRGVLVSQYT
jgi:hypothetical protein